MKKPSERIVVFVTPAQKRAISATADNLGISISELMRRAVLSFGATSEQVKAASIVDRLRAPREPDALNAALQRVARSSKHVRQATPAALRSPGKTPVARGQSAGTNNESAFASAPHEALAPIDLARPVDPVAALAALSPASTGSTFGNPDDEAAAQAAARVTAAKAAAIAGHDSADTPATGSDGDTRAPSRPSTVLASKRGANTRTREHEDDESGIDPTEGSGHFA